MYITIFNSFFCFLRNIVFSATKLFIPTSNWNSIVQIYWVIKCSQWLNNLCSWGLNTNLINLMKFWGDKSVKSSDLLSWLTLMPHKTWGVDWPSSNLIIVVYYFLHTWWFHNYNYVNLWSVSAIKGSLINCSLDT